MSDTLLTSATVSAEGPLFAGIDIGGTTIKCALVDDVGQTVAYRTLDTCSQLGPEDAARRIGQTLDAMIADSGVAAQRVVHVGLGSPGLLERDSGRLLSAANLPGWENFPLREVVSKYCRRPVTYVNDATAAALGEHWVGRGKQSASLILLTLGTGIGSGIIIDHRAFDGQHGLGSECGHIVIDSCANARRCGCGSLGHWEAYASATALIQRTHEALCSGRSSTLQNAASSAEPLTPKTVGEHAEAGDALALELVLETARFLGIGIASLLHVIDPDCVLLGGAMTFGGNDAPLGRNFIDRIRQEVRARALPVVADLAVIDFATLGGDAGYLGAAALAREAWRARQS